MKKPFLKISFLIVAGFLMMGAPVNELSPTTNINYTIVEDSLGNPGGGIKLVWSPPPVTHGGFLGCGIEEGPDGGYIIGVDGVDVGSTEETEFTLYTPGARIEVFAVYDGTKSTPVALDFKATETPTLEVYSVDDPSAEHPSGFGFSASGTASTYAVSNESNWPSIDYYIASGPKLAAPSDHLPDPINSELNAVSAETGTYDALKIVSPTDKNLYLTNRDLVANGLYGLWLDDNGTYDAGDLFGKAVVRGIDGYKVTFKFALQTKAGLRWVVTN